MNERVNTIVDSAVRVFCRYGVKRTGMVDIAAEAGIARQTLYNTFSNKDEVLRAAIRYCAEQAKQRVESKLTDTMTLADRLDLVFSEIAVRPFELIHTSPNAEDIINEGVGAAGKAAISEVNAMYVALITRVLEPYEPALVERGTRAVDVAEFVQVGAMAAKHRARDRSELDTLLNTLKTMTLRTAGQ